MTFPGAVQRRLSASLPHNFTNFPNFFVLLSLLCGFCYLFGSAHGFIPYQCANNVTSSKICCPPLPGRLQACGGPARGICAPTKAFPENVEKAYKVDDRYMFPIKFFTYMCECRGNFFGIACEECKPGWKGNNCDTKAELRIRRNIKTYSDSEKSFLRDLIVRSDQIPSNFMIQLESDVYHSDPLYHPQFIPITIHKFYAAMHKYASRSTLYKDLTMCKEFGGVDTNHGSIMFVLWHRYFMMLWERDLQRIAASEFGVDNFAIPFWDWIDNNKCEPCTNDLMGDAGEMILGIQRIHPGSPFRNFTEYCSPPNKRAMSHCYGCHSASSFPPLNRRWDANFFPTSSELQYVMEKKKYYIPDEESGSCDSFHKSFEGFCGPGNKTRFLWMHNKVHNMVTGSICCSDTAANDPLFILHHSQIDRLFQIWLMKQKPSVNQLPASSEKPGNCRDCNLVALLPAIRNRDLFRDCLDFGYEYDNYIVGKKGLDYNYLRQKAGMP